MTVVLKKWIVDHEERGGISEYGTFVDSNQKEIFPGLQLTLSNSVHPFQMDQNKQLAVGFDLSRNEIVILDLVSFKKHVLGYWGLFGFNYNLLDSETIAVKFKIPAEMKNDEMGVRFPWYPEKFYEREFNVNPKDSSTFPFIDIMPSSLQNVVKNKDYREVIVSILSLDELSDKELWRALAPNQSGVVFQLADIKTNSMSDGGFCVFASSFAKPISFKISQFQQLKQALA
jgi:hypothetical protein